MENSSSMKLDWLGFTVTEILSINVVLTHFGYNISDFVNTGKGSNGYKSCLRSESGVLVSFDGNENMGINFSISSSALLEFLSAFKKSETYNSHYLISDNDDDSYVLRALFRCIKNCGHLTRLDLCFDDIGNQYFSCDEITLLYNNGQIITKSRSHEYTCSDNSRECTGITHYFGSRQSDKMLRIYDKHLEQVGKGCSNVPDRWTRWEYEIKHKSANEVADAIIGGLTLAEVFLGILKDNFRIIEKDNSNISRCTTLRKFDDLLQGVSKLHLHIPVSEMTIERTERYVKHQCSPSLAALYASHDYDVNYILDIIDYGLEHMKPDKIQSINQYLENRK